jgi:hypothetical protein
MAGEAPGRQSKRWGERRSPGAVGTAQAQGYAPGGNTRPGAGFKDQAHSVPLTLKGLRPGVWGASSTRFFPLPKEGKKNLEDSLIVKPGAYLSA